jgi:hypothetical protein
MLEKQLSDGQCRLSASSFESSAGGGGRWSRLGDDEFSSETAQGGLARAGCAVELQQVSDSCTHVSRCIVLDRTASRRNPKPTG